MPRRSTLPHLLWGWYFWPLQCGYKPLATTGVDSSLSEVNYEFWTSTNLVNCDKDDEALQ
jgi:hypothetical protein